MRHKAIAETRETELGTLHVYEDFVNLKARLEDVKGVVPECEESPTSERGAQVPREETALAQRLGNGWKPPDSCVDWAAMGIALGVRPPMQTRTAAPGRV